MQKEKDAIFAFFEKACSARIMFYGTLGKLWAKIQSVIIEKSYEHILA
jgi:hypothetical protein